MSYFYEIMRFSRKPKPVKEPKPEVIDGHVVHYIDYKSKRYHYITLGASICSFAIIGSILVLGSFAAVRKYASFESESTTRSGNTSVKSDPTAAGGSAISFDAPPGSSWTPAYPGQPRPGFLYWGASTGSGDIVARHETPTGVTLGVVRRFYQGTAAQVNFAASDAKADYAANRISMISFKPPGTWTDMGNGVYDSWIDDMLTKLDSAGGPIWLVLHHEPEGGAGVNAPDDPGGPTAHKAMNLRVRQRMTALGTKHIALSQVLMGCTYVSSTYNCPNRNPADWWIDNVYDFIGGDVYFSKGAATGVYSQSAQPIAIRKFAAQRGKDVAMFEWGTFSYLTAAEAASMQQYFNDLTATSPTGQARVVGLAYFDTAQNGGVPLSGTVLDMFHQLMSDPRATHWRSQQ